MTLPKSLKAEVVTFAAGTTIFREGEIGDAAYLIESGRIEIFTEDEPPRTIAIREAGELFGEMAIVGQGRRLASARAIQECRLLPITADRLSRFLRTSDPILRLVIDVLFARLKETFVVKQSDERAMAERSAIKARAVEQLRSENAFANALSSGEICLYYQPIVALKSREIVGFEALARWNHPERGLVAPAEFVPLAEASGLIGRLTRLCLEEAIQALPLFDAACGLKDGRRLFVNVNVSGHDLLDESFGVFLNGFARRWPIFEDRLKIEITESALMSEPTVAQRMLQQCRDLGIGVAIDDFGTGYSSLSYLHTLPINVLKIDRSFVRGVKSGGQSAKIVRTILRLAEELGIPAVSEGLEAPEEVEVLTEMGCHFGQGYHFGRPMPLDDARKLLKNRPASSRLIA